MFKMLIYKRVELADEANQKRPIWRGSVAFWGITCISETTLWVVVSALVSHKPVTC